MAFSILRRGQQRKLSRKAKFIQFTVSRDVASLLYASSDLKYSRVGYRRFHWQSYTVYPSDCLVHVHDCRQLGKAEAVPLISIGHTSSWSRAVPRGSNTAAHSSGLCRKHWGIRAALLLSLLWITRKKSRFKWALYNSSKVCQLILLFVVFIFCHFWIHSSFSILHFRIKLPFFPFLPRQLFPLLSVLPYA